jgi:hypothetical protein
VAGYLFKFREGTMKSISSLRLQSRLFYLLVIASLLIQMGFTAHVQAAAVAAPQASIQSATFTTCADATGIPQSECEVLVALYNSTGGANWTNNTGWLQTNTPCSWFGIECVPDYIYGILYRTWSRVSNG